MASYLWVEHPDTHNAPLSLLHLSVSVNTCFEGWNITVFLGEKMLFLDILILLVHIYVLFRWNHFIKFIFNALYKSRCVVVFHWVFGVTVCYSVGISV